MKSISAMGGAAGCRVGCWGLGVLGETTMQLGLGYLSSQLLGTSHLLQRGDQKSAFAVGLYLVHQAPAYCPAPSGVRGPDPNSEPSRATGPRMTYHPTGLNSPSRSGRAWSRPGASTTNHDSPRPTRAAAPSTLPAQTIVDPRSLSPFAHRPSKASSSHLMFISCSFPLCRSIPYAAPALLTAPRNRSTQRLGHAAPQN